MNLNDLKPKTTYDFNRNFKLAKYPTRYWNPPYSHTLSQECFVKLWQTSNSLDELMVKIDKINLMLSKYKVFGWWKQSGNFKKSHYAPSLSTESKGYIARATRYRNKGVPMKKLERFVPTPKRKHPTTNWEALAKIAEQSA